MASFSTKHLHFVPFNINPVAGRSRLLAASPNGLIFGTRENDLVVFRAADYVGASAISTLRKDKPLDTLRPNIAIPFSRQITWLAVNSNGSLLSVCSSSTDGATFVQLLEISKMLPTENFGFLGQPLDLTRPEAGAETNCPSAGSAIADLAWSPVDSNRLAVATHSGALRMFVCSGQDAQRPLTLVGSLPQTSQVKCSEFLPPFSSNISWSPKGKQLAVCLTGIIPNFPAVATTVILQLDPELRQKRVIPLSPILQSFSQFPQSRPIDMLWSSSYCFLVALEGPTPQHGTRVAFVSALPKCEPRGALVEDLAGACESTAIQPFQYHMRLWPNSGSLVAATWSSGGETCVLLDVPALSTGGGGPPPDSLPKLLTEMVLPSTRAPIALAMSVVLKDAEVLPLLVTRLGDGIVCAYEMLQGPNADPAAFAGFRTWLQAAAPAPNLPPPAQPAPTSVQSPPPTTTTASPPAFVSSSTMGVASATATPPTAIFGGTVFGQQSVPNTSSATPTAPTAIFGGTVFGQQSVSTTSTLASATTNASTLFGGTVFGQQSVSTASTPASATTNASALFGGTVFGQQSPQGPQPTFPAPSSATAISTSNAVSAAQPASPVEAQSAATTAPTVTPSIFSSGGLFGSATSVGGQSTGASGFGAMSFGRPPTPQPTPALSVSVANSGVGAAAAAQSTESVPLQSPTSPRGDVPLPSPPLSQPEDLKSPAPATTPQPLKQEAPAETKDADGQAEPPSPAPIPHSVLEASDQFSLALEAQAAETARAWQHLTDVFSGTSTHLSALGSVAGLLPEGCCKGVRDIEKSLTNMSTYLDVVNEITRQLEKATTLSLAEQKSLADFVERLHVDFEAYTDKLAPTFTAGLDPQSAAMLASLKKKSRSAETFLAELEDQLQSLSAQVEETVAAAAAGKPKPHRLHEQASSPLESVRRTLTINARLIAAERARIEMISRFSGISLSTSQIAAASPVREPRALDVGGGGGGGSSSRNHLTKSAAATTPVRRAGGSSMRTPAKCLPLGGSVVSIEREQRDAALYRLLLKAVKQPLFIHQASQTAGDLFKSTRLANVKEEGDDKKTPVPTQPPPPRIRHNPAASPGRIQGQQISRLLDRAASVPPVTLPTGGSPLPVAEPSTVTAVSPRSPPGSEAFSPAQPRVLGRAPGSSAVSPHTATPISPPEGAGSPPSMRLTSTPRWSIQAPGLTVKPPVGHVFQAGATTTPSTPAARLTTTAKKNEKPKSKPDSALLALQPFGSTHATSTASVAGLPRTAESVAPPAASVRTPTPNESPKTAPLPASLVSPPVVTTLSPTVKVFGAPKNLIFEASQTQATVTQSPTVPQIVVSPSTPGATTSAASTASITPMTTVATASPTSALSKPPQFTTTSTAITSKTSSSAPTPSSVITPGLATTSVGGISSPQTGPPTAVSPATASGGLFGQPTVNQPSDSSPAPFSFQLFRQAPTSKSPPADNTAPPATAAVSSSTPATVNTTPGPAVASSSSSSSLFSQSKFSFAGVSPVAAGSTTNFSFGPLSAATTAAATTTVFGGLFNTKPATTTTTAATSVTVSSAASTGGLFGTATTTTKPAEGGLFGQPATGLFAGGPKTSSLFGQPATGNGGLFGQKVDSNTTAAAATTSSQAATTTAAPAVSFFTSPTTSSGAPGGLFGDKTAPTSGGLFGTAASTAPGGLFGGPTSPLFGQPATSATVGAFSGLGLASSAAAPSATGSPFGQAATKPAAGGLFGAAAATTTTSPTSGLFGQTTASPGTGGGLFGQLATTTAAGTGLFGSPTSAAPSGGLFGASSQAMQPAAAAVNNLFAASNFGLGSPSSTSASSGGGGGLFGKPATSTTSVPGSTGLFGSPTSTTAAAPGGGGLFGAGVTPKPAGQTGLFATPTLGKTVFGATSTGGGGGGLFGSFTNTGGSGGGGGLFGTSAAPGGGGGGLFGSPTPAAAAPSSGGLFSSAAPASGGLFGASASGFGAPPTFGSASAGQANPLTFPIPSAPSAGAGGFGSPPVFGQSSPFGAVSAASPAAGGLFASLANSAGGSTFGSLAHGTSSPPAPQNLFGSSPSFTQRRA
ncbi:hypothetical protein SprV_0702341500 [Sparganum proliferum]